MSLNFGKKPGKPSHKAAVTNVSLRVVNGSEVFITGMNQKLNT